VTTRPTANDQSASVQQLPPKSLHLTDLTINAGDRELLAETNLSIAAGKITVIVGGSGAGKSVLLRTLAGLIPRNGPVIKWAGKIESGHDLPAQPAPKINHKTQTTNATSESGTDSENIFPDQPRIGIVFQQFALFDELSPSENVQFAIDHRNDRTIAPSQTSRQWLEELGVPAKTPVAALSGGQKQRLAIARTLAANPDIILYDEPTSGLDAASGGKVAELIRHTHDTYHRTSIIVTHDYETLIPIADEVLLLDSETRCLVPVPRQDWPQIPTRMRPVQLSETASRPPTLVEQGTQKIDTFLAQTGSTVVAALRLPYDLLPLFPRPRWGLRFFAHYLRLVGGVSAWVYLVLAGLIVGFTGTYFTFRFLPFRLYTQPLLIDELLSSIGFALYRILVPVLATILIAARCGAAVAADVGVKQYGGQIDAMRTLGVKPRLYLLLPIVLAFMLATPMLEWMAFTSARFISMLSFTAAHPDVGPFFWEQHFYRNLLTSDGGWPQGWGWVMLKNLVCGIGTGAIGFYRGLAPKQSASDVSNAITSTVLWATLYVLLVHFIIALIEF
jgi:ABC-type transporter Mla maintaining outer membrane lipid asymmetry ATPase subunit MlaF/ABC-type transporter Mla maintaining outer membrane lipid asymmetry permease subunit MlaE